MVLSLALHFYILIEGRNYVHDHPIISGSSCFFPNTKKKKSRDALCSKNSHGILVFLWNFHICSAKGRRTNQKHNLWNIIFEYSLEIASSKTLTGDTINKPIPFYHNNTFRFHCPNQRAISEPHCNAVEFRCIQFPAWIYSKWIYTHVVLHGFCLFPITGLQFSWCWVPTTSPNECHCWEYIVTQKQPSF